jgi:hypothetical protein
MIIYILALTDSLVSKGKDIYLPNQPKKYKLDFNKHHTGDFIEHSY